MAGPREGYWLIAAALAFVAATAAIFLLQFRLSLPPLTLVVSVQGTDATASAQYAVLDGGPFIHVRLPPQAQRAILSDLRTWTKQDDEPTNEELGQFWSDPVSDFLSNLSRLALRWAAEILDEQLRNSGQPPPNNPFPDGLPIDRDNAATCLFAMPGGYRFDFRNAAPGSVAYDANRSGDEVTQLDIRNGAMTGTFAVDLKHAPSSDLWCRLRVVATRNSLTVRSVEILNGLEVSAKTTAPLFVEPPLIEPQVGGEAKDILLLATTANAAAVTSSSLLSPGSGMLVSWTDAVAAGFQDLFILVIGALYGLAMAMALEAVRPMLSRRE